MLLISSPEYAIFFAYIFCYLSMQNFNEFNYQIITAIDRMISIKYRKGMVFGFENEIMAKELLHH